MRTKTLALSALLGLLGSVSAMAQNVYSVNAVGYINVTLYPGYNLVTCPLICSPDNTIGTLFNNSTGAYQSGTHHGTVYAYQNGVGFTASDTANTASGGTAGWAGNGTITINPGQAVFFYNNVNLKTGTNMVATFVGTVPQNSTALSTQLPNGLTNTLVQGYNLVGSIVPASGDIVTNSITLLPGENLDYVYVYDPTTNSVGQQGGYITQGEMQFVGGAWTVDPILANVYEGFWFHHHLAAPNVWVENFSVNP
jgi:hypothetical protein